MPGPLALPILYFVGSTISPWGLLSLNILPRGQLYLPDGDLGFQKWGFFPIFFVYLHILYSLGPTISPYNLLPATHVISYTLLPRAHYISISQRSTLSPYTPQGPLYHPIIQSLRPTVISYTLLPRAHYISILNPKGPLYLPILPGVHYISYTLLPRVHYISIYFTPQGLLYLHIIYSVGSTISILTSLGFTISPYTLLSRAHVISYTLLPDYTPDEQIYLVSRHLLSSNYIRELSRQFNRGNISSFS